MDARVQSAFAEAFANQYVIGDNAGHFTRGEVHALARMLHACGEPAAAVNWLEQWVECEVDDGETTGGDVEHDGDGFPFVVLDGESAESCPMGETTCVACGDDAGESVDDAGDPVCADCLPVWNPAVGS